MPVNVDFDSHAADSGTFRRNCPYLGLRITFGALFLGWIIQESMKRLWDGSELTFEVAHALMGNKVLASQSTT